MTKRTSIEIRGGPTPLVLTLCTSKTAATLEIREQTATTAHVRTLTERCSGLYFVRIGKPQRLVGILLRLTDGFAHLVDGFRTLKVKHMVEAGIVLDVRNTTDEEFREVVHAYATVNVWLEPYRGLVFPKEFGDLLRALP